MAKRARAQRGFTALEAAIGFAIVGSISMVFVPGFFHELHASKQAEATRGVVLLGEDAMAYANGKPAAMAFPPSAPLTPPVVARGTREVDPPGVWDHPTWKALGFRAVPEGVPHAYSFDFELSQVAGKSAFHARAHGDLDGDGTQSLFEIRGSETDSGPRIEPGLIVVSELE